MIPSSDAIRIRRRLVLLCGVVPVLLITVLALMRPAALARFDHATYDMMLRAAPIQPPGDRVVIVDVDERSLASVGQWPWRRDEVGRLVQRLREMDAAVIALDVIFAEPDRYPAGAGLDPDAALAEVLRDGRVILGYGMTFDPRDRSSRCVLHAISLPVVQSADAADRRPFFQSTGAICSLPALAEAAGASGFLNAAPDPDGILRRAPLLVEYNGRTYPSLALASVARLHGTRDAALNVHNVNAADLLLDDKKIPLDGRSNLLLRYRGKKRTFPYVSASDVLDRRVPADQLRGRIVLVGTTALGTREVVATPLDTLFVGVEVQATIADNLLRGDFVSRAPAAPVIEAVLVFVFGIGVALLFVWRGLIAGLISGAASVAALWFGSVWQLSSHGSVLSPLYPVLGIALGLAGATLAKVVVERRRAETAAREKTAAQHLMVQSLLSLTETRDEETGRHSFRTQEYTRLIAGELSRNAAYRPYLTPERVDLIASLAPLHDIGKVGIPDQVLNKPGPLTPDELTLMRTHPVLGLNVIVKAEKLAGVRNDAILTLAKDIVYTHHERWDGTGYPQGLKGDTIPIPGRLLAIVDVYDALTTRSLYRPPISHEEAVAYIVKNRATHFDPDVVSAFMNVAGEFQRISRPAAV